MARRCRRQGLRCCRSRSRRNSAGTVEVPQLHFFDGEVVQFLDKVVDMPAGVQHHGVVEVPQLQFIDKVFLHYGGGDRGLWRF